MEILWQTALLRCGPVRFDAVSGCDVLFVSCADVLCSLTLYAGTIYGSVILRRCGRLSHGGFATNTIVHGIHQLITPTAINHSRELKTESSNVAGTVRWIYAPILNDQ